MTLLQIYVECKNQSIHCKLTTKARRLSRRPNNYFVSSINNTYFFYVGSRLKDIRQRNKAIFTWRPLVSQLHKTNDTIAERLIMLTKPKIILNNNNIMRLDHCEILKKLFFFIGFKNRLNSLDKRSHTRPTSFSLKCRAITQALRNAPKRLATISRYLLGGFSIMTYHSILNFSNTLTLCPLYEGGIAD